MTDPVLRLDGLRKAFGDARAVDDLSLSVDRGEFFALLGPSGCGKTTTLRLVTGLERPDRGRVVVDGVDATDVPPHRRDVHLVFQDLVLFPHMTVAENVAYGLERAGWGRDRREARVAELLEVVGLPDAGDRDPAELSGGQRQRVALARSLAPEPAVLLLDEPLSSLDRQLREELRVELRRIQSEVGTTFVYVTHDQESAMRLADRLAVMRDGRLVEVGPPERLYERPDTEFVARFFSDANVLAGRLEGGDGGTDGTEGPARVRVRGQSVPLVVDGAADADPGEPVTVVVRPAAVGLVDAATGDGGSTAVGDGGDVGAAVGERTADDAGPDGRPLAATVQATAYRGEGYEYDLALADGTVVTARTGTATGPTGRERFEPGEEAFVRFAEATVVRSDDGGPPGSSSAETARGTPTDGERGASRREEPDGDA